MQLFYAMVFLFIMLFIAYSLKADFFLIIFLISVYLYILVFLFILNPFEIGLRVIFDLILKPQNLLIILVPFILIFIIWKIFIQIKNKKRPDKSLN